MYVYHYMVHVCFYVCCSDCVGVCGNDVVQRLLCFFYPWSVEVCCVFV